MEPIYDKEDSEEVKQLRKITGIGPEAEQAMEDQAEAGAQEDGGLYNPSKDKKASAKDLDKAERARSKAGGGQPLDALSPYAMLNELKGKLNGFRRSTKIAMGGVVAGFAIGGIIALLSIFHGPAEFIQIAQILQETHFAVQEAQSSARLLKMARDVQHIRNGQGYKTRLGFIGNTMADNLEANLNEAGLKSEYTSTFGLKEGYIIDRNSDQYKGMSDQEIKDYYKKNYDITVTDSGKELSINKDQLTFIKSRVFLYYTLREMGVGIAPSAIQAHVMGERDGVTWHPIKKLDGLTLKTIDEWWANRNTSIKEGSAAAQLQADQKPATDKDGKPIPSSQETAGTAAQSAESIVTEAQTAGTSATAGNKGPLTALQDSVHLKIAAGGAGAVGVLCLVESIANQAEAIKQAEVVLPTVRMGVEAITHGNQEENGTDASLDQDAKYNALLYDSTTNTSWDQAQSIQSDLGEPQTGQPADSTLTTMANGTPFDAILSNGIIKPVLNGACSTAGQAALFVVSFIGGPISTAFNTGVGAAVGPIVEKSIAQWLAGDAIDSTATGAAYGNIINFGARKAADDQAVSAGGRLLTSSESALLENSNTQIMKSEFSHQNLAYRLFSPTDSRSLMASVMDGQPPTLSGNISKMASGLLTLGNSLGSTFSSIFTTAVHADSATSSYDYGWDIHGNSSAEMDDPAVEHPFANADAAADILSGPNGQTYIDRASKCFGDTILQTPADGGAEVWDVQYETSAINTFAADYKTYDCNDSSTDWLRIRFFINDTGTMKSYACLQGDDESCSEMGFGAPADTSTTAGDNGGSNTTDCPVGTDQGVQDGYQDGDKIPVRICLVDGTKVSTRIAANFDRMITAANKAGIKLSGGSGFRTAAEQHAARVANGCPNDTSPSSSCRVPTAPVGYSNHQMGLAVDYQCNGQSSFAFGGTSCFSWMKSNASTYGFKNLPSEAWHWSIDGT